MSLEIVKNEKVTRSFFKKLNMKTTKGFTNNFSQKRHKVFRITYHENVKTSNYLNNNITRNGQNFKRS